MVGLHAWNSKPMAEKPRVAEELIKIDGFLLRSWNPQVAVLHCIVTHPALTKR